MVIHYTVYILFSEKLNRFYTGYTSNLDIRIDFHLNSLPNKFTANAKDWKLFFKLECDSKQQALKIEKHIKRMRSKIYIQNLVLYPEVSDKLLNLYMDC